MTWLYDDCIMYTKGERSLLIWKVAAVLLASSHLNNQHVKNHFPKLIFPSKAVDEAQMMYISALTFNITFRSAQTSFFSLLNRAAGVLRHLSSAH